MKLCRRRTRALAASSSVVVVVLQEIAKRGYVGLGHLQGLELAELVIGPEAGHDLPKLVEGVVEAVHASPLPSVRGQAPALENARRRRDLRRSATSRAAAAARSRSFRAAHRLGRLTFLQEFLVRVIFCLNR